MGKSRSGSASRKRAAPPEDDIDSLLAGGGGGGVSFGAFLLGLVLGLAAGGLGVLVAHARHADVPLEKAARTLMSASKCRLGEICTKGPRPALEDGGKSHVVWDLPRYHMRTRFEEVRRVYPEIQVSYLWDDPVVVYFDNALSEKDIELMTKMALPRMSPSTIVQPDGSSMPDPGRTSDTAWLHFAHHDKEVSPIVNKLVSLAGFAGKNAESLGVNRYRPGQYFKFHFDWMDEEGVVNDPMFPKGCQRAATVLAYLSDTEKGGETVFIRDEKFDFESPVDATNEDHLVVRPKKGRVLVWFDMHPYREKVDHRTLHGGEPVIEGEKLAATIFIRNCTRAF